MNDKFKTFMKSYAYTMVAFAISLAYVFIGYIRIDRTGKTIWQIVADGFTLFCLAIIVDMLFGAQGIQTGRATEPLKEAESRYRSILLRVRSMADKLQAFCEKKNRDALKTARTQILLEKGYRYTDHFEEDGAIKPFPNVENEDKKERKRRWRAFRKARDFKVTMLTIPLLATDESDAKDPNAMGRSITRFMTAATEKNAVKRIMFSFVCGFFGVEILRDASVETLIFTIFKVATILGFGTMKFIKSKLYITGEYRDRVETKTRLLEEFEAWDKGEQDDADQTRILENVSGSTAERT